MILHGKLIHDDRMVTLRIRGEKISRIEPFRKGRGLDRILLTTDAISAAGQPPGKYKLGDLEIEVGEDGGTRLVGTDSLAGSTLSMPKAINNVIQFTGIHIGTAIKMATENGRKLFPQVVGAIAPNQPANLVLFRFNGEVKIEKTILMGKEVWSSSDYK